MQQVWPSIMISWKESMATHGSTHIVTNRPLLLNFLFLAPVLLSLLVSAHHYSDARISAHPSTYHKTYVIP